MKYKIKRTLLLFAMLFVKMVYATILLCLLLVVMPLGIIFWNKEDCDDVINHVINVASLED